MSLRRLSVIAAIAIFIGTAGCVVTSFIGYAINPTLSPYYGLKLHKGLDGEASILRDKWGIAHIQADNEPDMFFAVGYAQAQDRLFQMDMFRHLIAGRLAEIVGDRELGGNPNYSPTTILMQDKIHRIIGFEYLGKAGAALMKEYRPDLYRHAESYSAGVNAYIEDCGDKLPMEFKVLDYKPDPWSPADVVALGRFVGWMLASNLDMELMRWAFANKFDEKMAYDLLPLYEEAVPAIPTIIPRELKDYRKITPVHPKITDHRVEPISAPAEAILELSKALAANRAYGRIAPFGHASNSWVVGPQLTASGKPILANDPHLSHGMPATFWQAHMVGAGFDAYGVTFPGLPYIVIGHNRHFAWGLTTSLADVQDIYIEKLDEKGENYLYKGEWVPIARRKEVLKARKGLRGPVEDAGAIEVRLTRHGPIINDIHPLLADAPPMALRWVGYDYTTDQELARALMNSGSVGQFMEKARKLNPDRIAHESDTILMCMKGESIDDFKKALAMYGLPNQNWVFVDDVGNFGYMAAGRVPVRARGMSTMPVPGWTGEYEWVGFIPPEHIPQVFNPARGYVATANNRVVPPDDYPYVFSYSAVPGWRAMRIEQLLVEKSRKKKLTAQDMAEIQNDVKMLAAEYMVPLLLKALDGMEDITSHELAAKETLEKWDCFATADSVASSIFNEWHMSIPRLLLEDELGAETFDVYINFSMPFSAIEHMILNDTPFFDNKTTPEVESRDVVFRQAFRQAVSKLRQKLGNDIAKWHWGKLHTIEFEHPLSVWPFGHFLNYGPLPHHGGLGTVRNASHLPDDYRTRGGPCLRHVVDMADVENSLWVIDGGQSGQWKSPHYTDGAEIWYKGEYIRAIMNLNEVAGENEGLLKLRPLPE